MVQRAVSSTSTVSLSTSTCTISPRKTRGDMPDALYCAGSFGFWQRFLWVLVAERRLMVAGAFMPRWESTKQSSVAERQLKSPRCDVSASYLSTVAPRRSGEVGRITTGR